MDDASLKPIVSLLESAFYEAFASHTFDSFHIDRRAELGLVLSVSLEDEFIDVPCR